MRLEYDLTPEDYLRFAEYHTLHSPEGRSKMWVLYLTVTLVAIATAFVQAEIWGWFCWPLYGAYIVLLPLYAGHLERERTHEQITDSRDEAQKRGRFGRHTLTLGADGIARARGAMKDEWHWEAISRVETSREGVTFYFDSVNVIIVPASAFADDEERHTFLEAVMQYREQAAGIDTPS